MNLILKGTPVASSIFQCNKNTRYFGDLYNSDNPSNNSNTNIRRRTLKIINDMKIVDPASSLKLGEHGDLVVDLAASSQGVLTLLIDDFFALYREDKKQYKQLLNWVPLLQDHFWSVPELSRRQIERLPSFRAAPTRYSRRTTPLENLQNAVRSAANHLRGVTFNSSTGTVGLASSSTTISSSIDVASGHTYYTLATDPLAGSTVDVNPVRADEAEERFTWEVQRRREEVREEMEERADSNTEDNW